MAFLLRSNIAHINLDVPESLFSELERNIRNSLSLTELQQYMKRLFLNVSQNINEMKELNVNSNNKIIETIKEYIDKNYQTEVSLDSLSKLVYLTPVYVSFLFKSITGENYVDYLRKIRLEKAKELLIEGKLKIYEVSHWVGYKDYKYFTNQFKKEFGVSPSHFRDRSM